MKSAMTDDVDQFTEITSAQTGDCLPCFGWCPVYSGRGTQSWWRPVRSFV